MDSTNSPKVRRGRFWSWLAGVLVLLLVAGSIVVLSLGKGANRRLSVAMAAADRDDPNWRLDDLIDHRDRVPDAENSSLVVNESVDLSGRNWPYGTGTAQGVGGPTTASNPIAKAFAGLAVIDENVRLDEGPASVLREELLAREPALALARKVGDYDRGHYVLVLGQTLVDTRLPHVEAVRAVAHLLEADVAVRARDGDLDDALDSCGALLGTARSIGDEPLLISQLVRGAIDGVAAKSVRRVLGQGEPSDAALSQVQALMLDEQAQPLLLMGMKGERAMLFELIRRLEGGGVRFSAITNAGSVPSAGARFGDNLLTVLARGVLGGQRALALEWMNEAVAISRRPAWEQPDLWAAWEGKIVAVKRSRFGQFTAMLPVLLVPATHAASDAFRRAQAELGATAILIAAERQRQRTGKWPGSIKAIDPKIMPRPPMDPFSGEPFHLEHRDGQLFIYSIGANGKDEHGAFDLKKYTRGGADDMGARGWDVKLRGRPAGETQE
jgi:hypothetical protein